VRALLVAALLLAVASAARGEDFDASKLLRDAGVTPVEESIEASRERPVVTTCELDPITKKLVCVSR
jgi:hypothetical protein